MGDFFHGWRRKTGVAMLLLALAFMIGWVRSFNNTDIVWLPTENGMTAHISDRHGLVWLTILDGDPEGQNLKKVLDRPFIRDKSDIALDLHEWEFESSLFGFEIVERHQNESSGKAWIIPHWSVTVPLTLISLWLLLSKPRKTNQEKITEPVTEKVA